MELLQVNALGFTYGEEFTLRDFTFPAHSGEVICILGPNGSGKTTLFNVLAGLFAPSEGTIYLNGEDYFANRFELSSQLMAVPFIHPLSTVRTPYLFLRAMGLRYNMTSHEINERTLMLAADMCMEKNLHTDYNSLSLGMIKKSFLMAAFLPDVKIRLLDEPFSGGIDPLAMEMLMAWIARFRDSGECLMFSSQMVEHAERIADKVMIVGEGRMVFFGTKAEMISHAGINPGAERAFAQAYITLTEK